MEVARIRNEADHQRLSATVRYPRGNGAPAVELTRLTRLLRRKDDSASDLVSASEASEAGGLY